MMFSRVRHADSKYRWAPCQVALCDLLSEAAYAKRLKKKPEHGEYVRARDDMGLGGLCRLYMGSNCYV